MKRRVILSTHTSERGQVEARGEPKVNRASEMMSVTFPQGGFVISTCASYGHPFAALRF